MRTEEEVLRQFNLWAQKNNLIRAAVLTGSRVNPDQVVEYSICTKASLYENKIRLEYS